jgi:S1-C subfamily serine protease
VLVLALAIFAPQCAAASSMERAMRSVVSVIPQWPPDARRTEEPEGSGVVILDGRTVLTAAHVVAKALSVSVRTWDGEILEAAVKGQDRATDLAVLTIPRPLPAMQTEVDDPELGEEVCAIGNAQGAGLSLRCGVVSALHRAGMGVNHVEDFIQTDASVNPGDSGGALVNRNGRLVGSLSAIFASGSDTGKGLNFAVSARLAAHVAAALVKEGRFKRVISGLKLEYSRTRGEPILLAARVVSVRPGLLGEKAGIEPGDIIIRAGGRRIRKPPDFVSVMAGLTEAGMDVTVIRDGRQKTLRLAP